MQVWGWDWSRVGLDWGGRLLFVFIHGSLEVVVWGLMWYLRMASFQIQVSVPACSEACPAILFGMDSEDGGMDPWDRDEFDTMMEGPPVEEQELGPPEDELLGPPETVQVQERTALGQETTAPATPSEQKPAILE